MHSTNRRLPFTKMEGLGNDYIYMENFNGLPADLPGLARRISDRHFGVGGDGLVLMGPSTHADFSMRIFNADGSEAEMCGNATRCVGKYLYERGLSTKQEIRLETPAGIRTLQLSVQDGHVASVRVDMGVPRLTPADIPLLAEGEDFINRELLVNGTPYRGSTVSMGNPHLVIFQDNIDGLNLDELGPYFERHPLFPKRTNTEFVEIIDRVHLRMRVWERGAGETLACGTGACAALVAAVLNGHSERTATVHLRGGDLLIEWAEDGTIFKSGPANFVFDGEYLV